MERRSALKKPVHSKGLLRGGIGTVRRLVMQLDLDDCGGSGFLDNGIS
jgi:hypothetical protein